MLKCALHVIFGGMNRFYEFVRHFYTYLVAYRLLNNCICFFFRLFSFESIASFALTKFVAFLFV